MRPSLTALTARLRADIAARLPGSAPDLRRGVLGTLVRAVAGALHSLYGYQADRALASNPATASGEDLAAWASIWGVVPRPAALASGGIALTGQPGAAVPAGSRVQTDRGVEFVTDDPAALDVAGLATVLVTAAEPGLSGNVSAGVRVAFVSPLTGVDAAATIAAPGTAGGADADDDDALRTRLLDVIQQPAHGGNAADYERWALEVGGITRAWCFPTYRGPGSVRVYVVDDDYAGPETAAPAAVAAVAAHIDAIKPVGVVIDDPNNPGTAINGLEVVAPTPVPVDFTIDDVPDDMTARRRIEVALADLFRREAVPEGGLALNKLIVTIGAGTGVVNFALSAPSVAPHAGAGEILTLGTITWI